MKKVFVSILTFVMMIASAGCSMGLPEPVQSVTPTVEVTATPTLAATQTPTPTVTSEPTQEPTPTPVPTQNISYTTGLPFSGEYKPVMCVIENHPSARPQTGLQTADVVYEVPIEGDITRFVCVFSDNVPSTVMPVRSGRVPFLYIQQEWDAAFMHYGGSPGNSSYTFYGNSLHGKIKIDVDGLKGGGKYFKRKPNEPSVHSVMGNPKSVQKLYKYNPEPIHWLFDSTVSYTGGNVTKINLRMCSGKKNFISYKYDPTNDVYLRSMSGKSFKSAETGKQVHVKNLIVQHTTYVTKGSVHYKVWKLVGKGKADIYIGGKKVKGTWERKSVDSETVFYSAQGKQVVLRPGNTWIEICK